MRKFILVVLLWLSLPVLGQPVNPAEGWTAAGEVESMPAGLRKIEYSITIQANVLRICAGGRFYDFIEADYDGDGPAIKPYLVEAVDAKGQPLACEAAAEIDPAHGRPGQ